jgi:hypothetical protein
VAEQPRRVERIRGHFDTPCSSAPSCSPSSLEAHPPWNGARGCCGVHRGATMPS